VLGVAWLGWVAPLSSIEALAQARIDARNLVPGIVDAPVFDVDGRTRLDAEAVREKGTVYVAQVYVGSEPDASSMLPVAWPFGFGSGPGAGYWQVDTADGMLTVWPFQPGDPMYLQVRVYELYPGATIPELAPYIYEWGYSQVLRVETRPSGEAVPLSGLQSFSFEKRRLLISLRRGEVVVAWLRPIGGGYILEAAAALGPTMTWEPVAEEKAVPPRDRYLQFVSVTNQVSGPLALYRLRRLWNPVALDDRPRPPGR